MANGRPPGLMPIDDRWPVSGLGTTKADPGGSALIGWNCGVLALVAGAGFEPATFGL